MQSDKLNDAQTQALLQAAKAAQLNAYAPYSNFLVGAAVAACSSAWVCASFNLSGCIALNAPSGTVCPRPPAPCCAR